MNKSPYKGFIFLNGKEIKHKYRYSNSKLTQFFSRPFESIRAGISVNLPRNWLRCDGYLSWAKHKNALHIYAIKTRCGVPYARWKKLYEETEKIARKLKAKKLEIIVVPLGIKNHLPLRLLNWDWHEAKQTFLYKILRQKRFEKIL
jgi:hypothetical protein